MRRCITLALAVLAAGAVSASQKPSQGKVRIHVTADAKADTEGPQQRASELDESAKDLSTQLKKRTWIEHTDDIENADIQFRIVARGKEVGVGLVLKYVVEAGAFRSEDEYYYNIDGDATTRRRARGPDSGGGEADGSENLSWGELAKLLAESLDEFAEANYERILAQR